MGGGDLNQKKSWHPQTLKNQEKVWKAEQAKNQEEKKLRDLRREIEEEKNREELKRIGETSGVLSKRDNDSKLEWMYKNSNELINREEYLLGRTIDKSFETLEAEERQRKQNIVGVKQPINHVEHDVVPFSIRAYRNVESHEQVDLQRKVLEDPLMLIKQKELESRKKILENPVKLKELHRILKTDRMLKEKTSKKKNSLKKSKKKHKKRSKHSSELSSDSEKDLDRQLEKRYKKLQKRLGSDGAEIAGLNLEKLLDTKYETLSKELDKAFRAKKRSSSDESEEDDRKRKIDNNKGRAKNHSRSRNEEPKRTIRRSMSSNKSQERSTNSRSRERRVQHPNFSRQLRRSGSIDDRRNRFSNYSPKFRGRDQEYGARGSGQGYDARGRYQNRFNSNPSTKHGYAKHRSRSTSRPRRRGSNGDSPHRLYVRQSWSNESRQQLSSNYRPNSRAKIPDKTSRPWAEVERRYAQESSKDKRNTISQRSSDSREKRHSQYSSRRSRSRDKQQRRPNRSRSGGKYKEPDRYQSRQRTLSKSPPPPAVKERVRRSKTPSSRRTNTNGGYNKVRQRSTSPTGNSNQTTRKKLTEEEKEKRRRAMMENAAWRETDRTQVVQKHRAAYAREEEQHRNRDFDKNFINKEVSKAIANHTSVETRIRSNLNNIQRSSASMNSNFARK